GARDGGILRLGEDRVAEVGEVWCAAGKTEADARRVEVGVVVSDGVGDVAVVEDEPRAAAEVVPRRHREIEANRRIREAEASRLPGRPGRDAGRGRGLVAERAERLEEGVRERPDLPQPVVPADHVEWHAPLVQVDQEATKTSIKRINVVEQPEDVGLTPR